SGALPSCAGPARRSPPCRRRRRRAYSSLLLRRVILRLNLGQTIEGDDRQAEVVERLEHAGEGRLVPERAYQLCISVPTRLHLARVQPAQPLRPSAVQYTTDPDGVGRRAVRRHSALRWCAPAHRHAPPPDGPVPPALLL